MYRKKSINYIKKLYLKVHKKKNVWGNITKTSSISLLYRGGSGWIYEFVFIVDLKLNLGKR